MESAEGKNVAKRVELCEEAEALASSLPAENTYVKAKLREASMRLRRASEALLSQSVRTSEV